MFSFAFNNNTIGMGTPTRRSRWDFLWVNQRWQWQRINADGSVSRPSSSYATLGVAADDARQQGFRPSDDDFLIDDEYTISYFTPTELPRILDKNF